MMIARVRARMPSMSGRNPWPTSTVGAVVVWADVVVTWLLGDGGASRITTTAGDSGTGDEPDARLLCGWALGSEQVAEEVRSVVVTRIVMDELRDDEGVRIDVGEDELLVIARC